MLHAGRDQLGECPVWDERHGILYRLDVVEGAVLALDVSTGQEQRFDLGCHVGSLVTRDDDRGLIVAAEQGFAALDTDSGSLTPLASVRAGELSQMMNDGKCDPQGRFLAGTMHPAALPGHGALFRYDPPAGAVSLIEGVGISNGLAWDSLGTTLYYIDSLLGRVDRMRYDGESGRVFDRRPAFDLGSYPGMPDGMTSDAEDCLWIAFWRGGAVRRFDPTGHLLTEIRLPVTRTTSCCLGGDDLSELYITTARRSLRGVATDANPLAGAVFHCRVEVPGLPAHRWRPPHQTTARQTG
ncbi:SMP-30/gluconolactonase/LRE family protein [Aeromicrobium sp.]|uniref:SMP-30/gluconolactonase/LRE family protein n=1 Tax=Aeromicrobium sp. TaxID=1871063 RepID=UPI00199630D4|nr:SMP-30/gluconolactonase/LRE family protein [Aeromicrobium sp.]MBC7632685.1 SMP-30/gluconolactonase/LRE family protein [Aeromicrobium sp.]